MGNATSILENAPTLSEGADYKSTYSINGKFATSDRTDELDIRFAKKGVGSEEKCPATTLHSLFQAAVDRHGDKVAMRAENPGAIALKDDGSAPDPLPLEEWKAWTFKQYYDETRLAAKGFIALGLEPLDGTNIFGFNSPYWFMGEMAAIFAGGVAAGIYPSDTPDQVLYKSKHSSASIAVVETEKQAKAFTDNLGDLPKLKAVVIWAPTKPDAVTDVKAGLRTVRVLTWDSLLKLAEGTTDAQLDERLSAQTPGKVCSYIYTSGTTGNPKAVMISHDNIIFEASVVLHTLPFIGNVPEEERIISFLPLSHVAGMMVDIVCPIVIAAKCPGWMSANFARPYDLKIGSIGDRLRTIKPTLFLGVPRVWEKIAEKLKKVGKATKGLKKKLSTFAKAKSLEHQLNCQLGGSGDKPFGFTLADGILNKIKKALGLECCKFGFTGAAPITKDTLEYFGSLGLQINEVYGMSECTGGTTWSTDDAHVWGSCGWALAGTEVAIFKPDPDAEGFNVPVEVAADIFNPTEEQQGEICFRGRHIMMGYMANPDLGPEHVAEIEKKTAGAIDKLGWLHSGDKGCVDARGMIKITGRYKELIIGAGGENIAPVPIEDNIKRICPAVSNIMMIGDKRKFNVCVLTLKAKGATGDLPGGDELDGEALEFVNGVTTISGASENDEFIKKITDAITATNKDGAVCPSAPHKIQKFTILPVDFSVTTDELTPTLKLKRTVVEKKYAAMIEKIYASKENYVKYEA